MFHDEYSCPSPSVVLKRCKRLDAAQNNQLSGRRQAMVATGGVTGERLKSLIERVERLEEEKAALAEDIREVYSEAKGSGFDVKIMRQIVRLRKMDTSDRQEQEAILDTYMAALGMR